MDSTNSSENFANVWLKLKRVANKKVSFEWVKPVVFFSLLLFGVFLLGEFAASYLLFRRAYFGYSALWQVMNEFCRVVSKKLEPPNSQESPLIRVVSEDRNPFMTSYADRKMTDDIFRIHPFIDYTNVSTRLNPPPKVDYFGFRNSEDLYFETPSKDTKLIVFTGGSEAGGHRHRITISERLEKILNSKNNFPKRYRVLNLAMNGYALSHEISAFVHLAYHLHPAYVISHSGWNDVINGSMIPANFKKLGLNYIKFEEYWLPRLYELKEGPSFLEWTANDEKSNWILESYFSNVDKFSKIVKSSGGKFILGVQPYNRSLEKMEVRDHQPFYLKRIHPRYEQLQNRARGLGYFVFSDYGPYSFGDSIHTLDDSAQKIAEFYASIILTNEKNGEEQPDGKDSSR